MSSICGIFFRDGQPVEPLALDEMVGVLAHWGPDRIGTWRSDAVGFGHLSLWTTPEAMAERCPFVHAESGITVTADARIDNREDLIEALGLRYATHEVSDHELIARAYERWGEDCVAQIVGDFAFALWDPGNRRLFCARDPLGIRPLYYFADDRRFVFGTEIKAIFSQPDIPTDWNPLRFALFVIGGHFERDQTQFRSIRSVEPATTLTIDASRLRVRRYWRLDPEHEVHFRRDDDYVDAFEDLFQRAVDARLRSSHRVGTMLSGGLDATTMTSFARSSRRWRHDTLAYTWALHEGDDWLVGDERPFVEAYRRDAPLCHQYIVADTSQMFADRPEIRHLHDGPNWDLAHYTLTPTFAHAQDEGIRVLLFGNGGDETASHFAPDYLRALMLNGKWPALTSEIAAQAALTGRPAWRTWKQEIVDPWRSWPVASGLFGYQRFHRLFLGKAKRPDQFCVPLAHSSEIAGCGLIDHLESQRPRFDRAWRHPVRCSQIALLTGTNLMATTAVHKFNTSVLHRIECRYPYLDRRVVEFCVAVPPRQHRHAGWSRRLLRRAADKRIPVKIARRPDKTLTFIDAQRGIAMARPELEARFARWSANRRVTSFVDIPRLRHHIQLLAEGCEQRRIESSIDTGSFCRAVLLGSFLENASVYAVQKAPAPSV